MSSATEQRFDAVIFCNNETKSFSSAQMFVDKIGDVKGEEIKHILVRLRCTENMEKKRGTFVLMLELRKLLENKLTQKLSGLITIEPHFLWQFDKEGAVNLMKEISKSIRNGVKFKKLIIHDRMFTAKIADALLEDLGPEHSEFFPPLDLRVYSSVELNLLVQCLKLGWPTPEIKFLGSFCSYLPDCKEIKGLLKGSKFTISFSNSLREEINDLSQLILFLSGAEGNLKFQGFYGYWNELLFSILKQDLPRWNKNTAAQVKTLEVVKVIEELIYVRGCTCTIAKYMPASALRFLSEMYSASETRILLIEKIRISENEDLRKPLTELMNNISNQNHSLISFYAELGGKVITIPIKLKKQIEENLSKKMSQWIKSGTEVLYGRFKLMVVGKGGAGKSSTLRSLLGKPFDRSIESTVVAEADKGISIKVQDVSSEWKETSVEGNWVEEEMGEFLRKVEKNVNSEEQNIFVPVASETPNPTELSNVQNYFVKKQKPIQPQNFIQEDVAKNVSRELNRTRSNSTENEKDNARLTIWDFGGQEEFYAIHHLFLTKNGFYILTFDLSLMLKETESEIRIINFWLESIGLHATGSSVILVGTRSNKVKKKHLKKIDLDLVNVIEDKKIHHIDNNNLSFFPIDNSDKRKIEKMIQPLRRTVQDILKTKAEHNDTNPKLWQTKVPLSWIYFMNHLLSKFKEIITVNQLFQVGKQMGLDNERDILPMVEFYRNAGGIVPFNRESLSREPRISEYIVLYPNWLLKVMASFVYDPKLHKKNKKFYRDGEMRRLISNYEKSGVLSEALLFRLLKQQNVLEKDFGFILGLCEEMLIMTKVEFQPEWSEIADDTFYLVPTMNRQIADKNLIDNEAAVEDCNNIFLYFKRAIPIGLFERVVCIMLTCNRDYDGTTLQPTIKKNFAIFCFRDVEVFLVDETADNCFRISIQKVVDGNLNVVANLLEIGYVILNTLRSDVLGKKIDCFVQIKSLDKAGNLISCSAEDLKKACAMKKTNVKTFKSDGSQRLKPIALFNVFSEAAHFIQEREDSALLAEKKGARLSWVFDCFLAHTWGPNNETHEKVVKIDKLLRERKFRTWLDEANLKYFVANDIVDGLKTSSCILVFITQLYLDKVEDFNTNASKEFFQAVSKGTEYMVAVVLDPNCLDPRSWAGSTVGYNFSDALYFDFSSDEKIKANIGRLCKRIEEMSKAERPKTLFD